MQPGEQLNLLIRLIESSDIRTNRYFVSSIPKVTERFHTVSRRGIKCVVARHLEAVDPLGAAIDVEVAINGWYHDARTNLLTLANEGTGLLIISSHKISIVTNYLKNDGKVSERCTVFESGVVQGSCV